LGAAPSRVFRAFLGVGDESHGSLLGERFKVVVVSLVARLLQVAEHDRHVEQGCALETLRHWVEIGARPRAFSAGDLRADALDAVVAEETANLQLIFFAPIREKVLSGRSCETVIEAVVGR
jgi:hypothetical protein